MPTVELAACQVFVTADDYASEARFEALLARVGRRLDAARARRDDGRFAHPCLAVFPEMIGAFLPLVGRFDRARFARTTDAALARVALGELPALARAMLQGGTLSPKVGFLLAAAPEVRRIYRGAFARFARAHRCWLVAGSALLPKNAFGDLADPFAPEGGAVYNTSYAFSPDGAHVGVTRKVHLVPTLEDALGLSPGRADALTAFDAPFGKVGTLICYDGFSVAHTDREPGFRALAARHDAQGAVVVAQPAANPWPWDAPWRFFERGAPRLRREQWRDEGLFAQLDQGAFTHLRYAVTAQLLGQVFDSRFDGRSQLLERGPQGARVLAEAARAEAHPDAEEVLLRRVQLLDSASESAALKAP